MPAVVRGGSRVSARPRAKAPASRAQVRTPPRQTPSAPSKLRTAQRVGLRPQWALLAAVAAVCVAMGATLATGDRAEATVGFMGRSAGEQMAWLGFRLKALEVRGASEMATADILKVAGVKKDQALLAMDLEDMRFRIAKVPWVEEASVVRVLPDRLVIAIKERKTLAVWQHGGRHIVIDHLGRPIVNADPGRFADLPLVVGRGAAAAAPEIMPSLAARPRLMHRLEALVRVDNRRWDIRLKDGALVQLPANDFDAALIQLDQLDQRGQILERGFERIDLRNSEMVTVRQRLAPPPEQQTQETEQPVMVEGQG
jgi:cell division protein FtsQ